MSGPPIKLGLLDFSWIGEGQRPADALRDTVALGAHADALGYARYWLGEHHVEGHASGSPQVLAAIVAAGTTRIRVGVGAMLLHYWSALKLAEDFRLLEAVYGRIDVGVGRGRADNLWSHRALLDGRQGGDGLLDEEEYGDKLDDLVDHLQGTIPPRHPHFGAAMIPDVEAMPEVWVCGSSTAAAQAARTGTRFCCTLFHGRVPPAAHIQEYKGAFRPSAHLGAPHAAVAVAGICAETEAEALDMLRVFPNPHYVSTVVGDPEQCRARIELICCMYGVDELILLDIAPDAARRMRSVELLAAAFEMS